MENTNLADLLKIYNSISPSRNRWVRNRNELKNRWKELFVALEKASGRDGVKLGVFDPTWHTIADKGSVTGAVNRETPVYPTDVVEAEAPVETPVEDPELETSEVSEEIADVVLEPTPLEEAITTGNPEVETVLSQEEIDAEELARMEAEEKAEIEAKKAEGKEVKKAPIKK